MAHLRNLRPGEKPALIPEPEPLVLVEPEAPADPRKRRDRQGPGRPWRRERAVWSGRHDRSRAHEHRHPCQRHRQCAQAWPVESPAGEEVDPSSRRYPGGTEAGSPPAITGATTILGPNVDSDG